MTWCTMPTKSGLGARATTKGQTLTTLVHKQRSSKVPAVRQLPDFGLQLPLGARDPGSIARGVAKMPWLLNKVKRLRPRIGWPWKL